jgi:nucleoside-diphosphate kinase
MQRTLVIIKPDGVIKGLTEKDIITNTDLNIIDTKRLTPSIEIARKHYAEHEGKDFFERITKALSSGEIIVILIEGKDAIKRVRSLIGSRSEPMSLRGKYSNPNIQHENAVHGSDSIESANREISIWFN